MVLIQELRPVRPGEPRTQMRQAHPERRIHPVVVGATADAPRAHGGTPRTRSTQFLVEDALGRHPREASRLTPMQCPE